MEAGDRLRDMSAKQRRAFTRASEQNRTPHILQRHTLLVELERELSICGGKSDGHTAVTGQQLPDPFQVLSFVVASGTERVLFVRPKLIADLDLITALVLRCAPPSTDALPLHFFNVVLNQLGSLAQGASDISFDQIKAAGVPLCVVDRPIFATRVSDPKSSE